MTRYEEIAEGVITLINQGVLRPGDRIPSIRSASRSHQVNPLTVMQAYQLLESQGWVAARPQSGYYVRARLVKRMAVPEMTRPTQQSVELDVSDFVFDILEATRSRSAVPLGSAFPSPWLFPHERLSRSLTTAMRRIDPWSAVTNLPPGNDELRRQIALRYLAAGANVPVSEIVVTAGALEALTLCLQAVTQPGDLVAIESPTFYACLQAIERLRLKAIEIPTHPDEGVDLVALSQALLTHPIKVCWFMTNFQNPLGSLMPDCKKQALVDLLARHEVPLIEDDVYGELYFDRQPPRQTKSYDEKGLVMHCASFSKSVAPGYRVGWVAAGRYSQAVQRLQFMTTLASSIPPQVALADFLKYGGYEPHLRRLRRALATQLAMTSDAIARYFPEGTRLTKPQGGYFLWIELPVMVDAVALHRLALSKGISIAPGPIFSAKREFRHFIRLNYGHPFTEQQEMGLATLGELIKGMMVSST
ncbi:PLP-dependent aminotransferase family protein [Chitinivorax sp. B]|uniref:aminotransferase-like domain-containing protein n=1 Tax=Chitinivorax sp. B TaxID=2502235 RepID=UPI0010F7624D|nr:PLP-dependent aminotransferase family protein [Chitinivorax sp. B]